MTLWALTEPWAARGGVGVAVWGGIQGIPSVCLLMTSGCKRFIIQFALSLGRCGCGGAVGWGRWSQCLCPQGGLSAAPSRAVSAVKNINLPEIPRNINIGDINIKVPNLSQFM